MIEDQKPQESPNEALLTEIREDYTYFRDYWRENHEEAKTDLRFVSGDPWEPKAREEREEHGRPVVSPDELDQYLNQAINNMRQSKRAIEVHPAGSGAEDQDAERRSAIIQAIQYDSKAQAAYANAFESAINCGFGFFRVTTRVVKQQPKEIHPAIKRIQNPLSVLPDPDAKEADFSDQQKCFVLDTMRISDFGRKYPNAQKKSFDPGDADLAPGWLQGEGNILVAEYWKAEGTPGNGAKVTQYITNGFEILEKKPWAGSWIPIIPCTGKELYIPKGGEVKRMYYSMIRKARGAQQMLAYIASQEAEEYGMAPRAPFVGYAGQFEGFEDDWALVNKVPKGYLQVRPTIDEATQTVLPLPTRPAFVPNAQAYEIGKESWRRHIQSSMGIMPLPTSAQRQNEKSGVALEKIQSQQSVGAYHFMDNFERSLENTGRQVNELLSIVLDTPRQVAARNPDDSHTLMHVVPSGQQAPKEAAPEKIFAPDKGDFGVTISTGPSYQSQREEASDFADTLVQNLKGLPLAPPQAAKLLSLAIKLKPNLGPLGDEMAEIISPEDVQQGQKMAQMQQQMQAMGEQFQKMTQELQQLKLERAGKIIDNQGKMAIVKMQEATKLAVAEITASKDANEGIAERENETYQLWHEQAHDIAMQKDQQAHERGMAHVEHAQAMQQAEQGALHQSALADQSAANQSAQSAQDAAQNQAAQGGESE